jgi:branched-chain amino acid transport system ATP-binding protein
MSGPRVLLMDEPSVGLAPKVVGELLTLGRAINASGVSILIVEQNARLALKFASWAYVLERGSVVASGAAAEIEASDAVRSAYLGNYRG